MRGKTKVFNITLSLNRISQGLRIWQSKLHFLRSFERVSHGKIGEATHCSSFTGSQRAPSRGYFTKNILHLAVMVRCGEYMCLCRSAIGPRMKAPSATPSMWVVSDLYLNNRGERDKNNIISCESPVLNEPLTVLLYNFVFRWSLLRTPRFINALLVRRLPPICSPRSPQTLICLFSPTAHSIFFSFCCWGGQFKIEQKWPLRLLYGEYTTVHIRMSQQESSRNAMSHAHISIPSVASFYACDLACALGRKWAQKCLGIGKGRVFKTIRDLGWSVSPPWLLCTSERKNSLHVSWGVWVKIEQAII